MKNRVPRTYFQTKGSGDSELEIHAGSYHMALKKANIHPYNIIKYSSVLPWFSSKESIEEGLEELEYGSELFTIMSDISGEKCDILQAGIAYATLYDQNESPIIKLVVECSKKVQKTDKCEGLRKHLYNVLMELSDTFNTNRVGTVEYITNEHTVTKKYGTTLVALCITEYDEE
jgi:arginine decarboxylase